LEGKGGGSERFDGEPDIVFGVEFDALIVASALLMSSYETAFEWDIISSFGLDTHSTEKISMIIPAWNVCNAARVWPFAFELVRLVRLWKQLVLTN
jgi:hypothetical protein